MLSETVRTEALAPYHLHAMPDADIQACIGVEGQGLYMRFYAKLRQQIIAEASFQTFSCPNAIACGSWITRWMEGRDKDVLDKLEADDLVRVLGGLQAGKEQIAVMAVSALRALLAQMPDGIGQKKWE